MTYTTAPAHTAIADGPLAVAGQFLDALLARDFRAVGSCLEPDVHLRALVPRGLLERDGPDAVAGQLRTWFATDERLELIDATVGQIGPRLYLRWRLRLLSPAPGGPAREVEQHAFVTVRQRIAVMDLLCCGFFTASAPTAQEGTYL
jgi:hypothetical protein